MSTHKNTFSATNHLSATLNAHFLPGDRDRRGTRFKAPVAVIAFYPAYPVESTKTLCALRSLPASCVCWYDRCSDGLPSEVRASIFSAVFVAT